MKINSSIGQPSPSQIALGNVPSEFSTRILDSYRNLTDRVQTEDIDGSSNAITQFAESVLRLLQNTLTGAHTPFGTHIANFNGECEKLRSVIGTKGTESERVIIPKALGFLWALRSKRGIGHSHGDVAANKIDLATVGRIADWILSELIRIHHKMDIEEAQAVVDALAVRRVPGVWLVGGKCVSHDFVDTALS